MQREEILRRAAEMLDQEVPGLDRDLLRNHVRRFLDRRDVYLSAREEKGSPLYLFDGRALVKAAEEFRGTFQAAIPDVSCFYAIKSNYHSFFLGTLARLGYGLDVSSGDELMRAVEFGPTAVIFSGPGKTPAELAAACSVSGRVTVLIDSFGELDRLQAAAEAAAVNVTAGVRVSVEDRGLWRKFGIPVSRLQEFLRRAAKCSRVRVEGIQYHTSWNLDTASHERFLNKLGGHLQALTTAEREVLHFLDIGGGFWPAEGEWLHAAVTPSGQLRHFVDPGILPGSDHRCSRALTIHDFAQGIRSALERDIYPYWKPQIYLEPGRWICHSAMHILLTVVDKKSPDLVITDGGTNSVGWERYEHDYFPVINLSRPSLREKSCLICGALCTPHDLWGYHYFGEDIEAGDVLLIPDQGAYTYSLRQQFIKSLPGEAVI